MGKNFNPFVSSPFASNMHLYAPTFHNGNAHSGIYHRRSSSVLLPNEWQTHNFSHSHFNDFDIGNANGTAATGITVPTIPQFTNPFSSSNDHAADSSNLDGGYVFTPFPEFTPASAAYTGSDHTS